MRIGIDVTCWTNRRGFGRFVRELIGAMLRLDTADEWVLFTDRQSAEASQFPSNARVVVGETKVAAATAAAADGRRSLGDMWAMRKAAQREPLDVFFFPAVYSYFPLAGRVPCVVTFHDTIADTLPHLVFHNRRSRWAWNAKCRLAQRRATAILTVSDASKRGLMEHFGMRTDDVHVMHEAASEPFGPVDTRSPRHAEALRRHGLDVSTPFLLYVGGISPHKNLATLIDAFARVSDVGQASRLSRTGETPVPQGAVPQRTNDDVRLVLVGDYAGDVFRTCHAELVRRAEAAGVSQRVMFPGYVPDEELAHLYAACAAFVFPSFLEGFGLPAVEAMACGAAVLASNRGSLPEVLNGAGLLFDPDDAAAMADAMRRVLADATLRAQLALQSRRRAADFSWEKSARRAVEILHKAAS